MTININRKESYAPSNVTVTFTFRGHDNIANAIWNDKSPEYIFASNITYELYEYGVMRIITTPVGYINPCDGAGKSDILWQDEREDAQHLDIDIVCAETGESILDRETRDILGASDDDYTELDGTITKVLSGLRPGNYKVSVAHERDAYYTEIANADTFAVYDFNVTKTVHEREVYVGESVTYDIVISNNGNMTLTDVSVREAIPEGFILIGQSENWALDGDTFYLDGEIPAWSDITLTLTFNATKVGSFTNAVTVKTSNTDEVPAKSNETLVKPYPSTVKGDDVEVYEGDEITVPVSS